MILAISERPRGRIFSFGPNWLRLGLASGLCLPWAACSNGEGESADESSASDSLGQSGDENNSHGDSMDTLGSSFEPFEGPIVSDPAPSSRFIRLNHRQWENTVRDLLRLPELSGLSSSFVAEPSTGRFDTHGGTLTVSGPQWLSYRKAAEILAKQTARDPQALAAIMPDSSGGQVEPRAFIEDFGARAYRRPLSSSEVTALVELFEKAGPLFESEDTPDDDYADGIELVLTAMLQSPHFLYRVEAQSERKGERIELSDYELANRLSYALTHSMPDAKLFAAADAGELKDRAGMAKHARRLLNSRPGQAMVKDFHDQVLHVREFETIAKDPEKFPLFGEGAIADLEREVAAFVDHVVFDAELGLRELLTADYSFANQRIAQMYDSSSTSTQAKSEFSKLMLDSEQRSGVLTQLGFLTANAEGVEPNIILRGVKIADHLLCLEVPPPPDAVPELPPLSDGVTNRQRVEELTADPACAGCHATFINPFGFALEGLDGVGQSRTLDHGSPVDTRASILLGDETVEIDGPRDLAEVMAASSRAHHCYALNWASYLYAREIDLELEVDEALTHQAGRLSWTIESTRNLIVELLTTDAFMTRAPEAKGDLR